MPVIIQFKANFTADAINGFRYRIKGPSDNKPAKYLGVQFL